MGADFELSINQNGQPSLLYIDKGNNKVNVGTKLSDFDIEKKLGQGHFGSVCLVKSKKTNKLYALKEIRGEIFNDNQRKEVEKPNLENNQTENLNKEEEILKEKEKENNNINQDQNNNENIKEEIPNPQTEIKQKLI